MKKEKISLYLVFISVLTFLTIFILIIQKGYNNLIGPIKKVQLSNLLKPISPTLDFSVVNQIENRKEYEFIESSTATNSSATSLIKPQ